MTLCIARFMLLRYLGREAFANAAERVAFLFELSPVHQPVTTRQNMETDRAASSAVGMPALRPLGHAFASHPWPAKEHAVAAPCWPRATKEPYGPPASRSAWSVLGPGRPRAARCSMPGLEPGASCPLRGFVCRLSLAGRRQAGASRQLRNRPTDRRMGAARPSQRPP